MKTSRPFDPDIFVRRPLVEKRAGRDRREVDAEAGTAGMEPFMEAAVAAAMIISHADGESSETERQRLVALFRSSPLLNGFSAEDVFREMQAHDIAFRLDRERAVAHARGRIVAADLSNTQFRALIDICVAVLDADGVRHAKEHDALADISTMRPWGYR